MNHRSGVLLHVSSLPGPGGIGSMGAEAERFVDFLAEAGQTLWQVLPLTQTSYGNSPYQSPSAFAGNPLFIDLEKLREEGLIDALPDLPGGRVDYPAVEKTHYAALREAFSRFRPGDGFAAFSARNQDWLDDYAVFMSAKTAFGQKPWYEWPEAYRSVAAAARDFAEGADFWKFAQYQFFRQWRALKAYAGKRGVSVVGDMPIYVAYDSVEVWARPELFALDERRVPVEVAGVPPDAFSEDGQLWGNPVYDWDYMQKDGYRWWIQRLRFALDLFGAVRIDHFRGFESYYAVPYGRTDARVGEWKPGPGAALFDALKAEIGEADIIAEDLGCLDDKVRDMVAKTGFPGMKVLQFAFDGNPRNEYLPRNYPENCAAYTGTHDNDTSLGWYRSLKIGERLRVRRGLRLPVGKVVPRMISALFKSAARTVILPMQDWLMLGSEARMNVPSTVSGNWEWRLREIPPTELAAKMRRLTEETGRLPRKNS